MRIDLELYRRRVKVAEDPPVRLSVIDVEPEIPQRTLVLLHGFAGHAMQWRYQIWQFSDVNRVISVDIRGHGQSDRPDTSYTMEELVGDLERGLRRLQVTTPIVLAGHSFGGAIAAEYAASHAEQVDKLILVATSGEFELIKLYQWAFMLPKRLLQLLTPFTRRWLGAPPHVLWTFYHNNLKSWNGWSLFRDITTPTLVIMGSRDRVFPRAVFEDVARCFPNAQAVDVGASAHMVMLERREAVDRSIERFIGERGGSWRESDRHAMLVQRHPWLRFYEESVPHTIGLTRRSLSRFLSSAARRFPRRVALRYGGGSIRYRRLDELTNRFANGLLSLGVAPGDRVMLLLPNLPQTVIAYYGTMRIGAVVVFSSPSSDEEELARQVEDSGAETLVTLGIYEAVACAVRQRTGLKRIVFTGVADHLSLLRRLLFSLTHRTPAPSCDGDGGAAWVNWRDLLRTQSPQPPDLRVDRESLALIQYTGGTTAAPKGVMLSHRNLVANTLQVRHWIPDLQEGAEVVLSVLPFSHSYGMTTAMNLPLLLGATMVLLSNFVTEEVLKTIKQEKPTLFPGVPTMYTAINDFPNVRRYGIESIRACISGAAPLPVEVQESFEKLTRGRLVEGYGLTEASPVTHANPLKGLRKVGSIGIPLPSTEARILDLATGQELPPGQIGELAVRGPQVMMGYWGRPEASRAVLLDSLAGEGRPWLLTGDVARMDEDGYCQIISRKQEMILAGEYQVYPRDVEEVLYEHPKVREAAVVGIPSTEPGQGVKAYVVLREGERATTEELKALCRARLEEWQVPWEIEFRQELPKSFVGKVLRRLLVETEAGGAANPEG
jgi:long-chain acyl-CoA synthetase